MRKSHKESNILLINTAKKILKMCYEKKQTHLTECKKCTIQKFAPKNVKHKVRVRSVQWFIDNWNDKPHTRISFLVLKERERERSHKHARVHSKFSLCALFISHSVSLGDRIEWFFIDYAEYCTYMAIKTILRWKPQSVAATVAMMMMVMVMGMGMLSAVCSQTADANRYELKSLACSFSSLHMLLVLQTDRSVLRRVRHVSGMRKSLIR